MTGSYPLPVRSTGLSGTLQTFFEPPDEFLLDAGQAGEITIARIRITVILMLLLVPLANLIFGTAAERDQHLIGFLITLFALFGSVLVYFAAVRGRHRRWLSFLTALFDVSLVSFALLLFGVLVDPHEAVNSLVTFPTYFLALGSTCLRFDPRVSLLAGLVAVTQYLALVLFAVFGFPALTDPTLLVRYTPFSWGNQISRLILLGAATALNIYIVLGMQRQRRLSTSDPLTGIFNRRFFDDHLANEIQRATRYSRPFAVAMIDIDHFKRLNDTLGHPAGDRALRALAKTLQRSLRRSDIVARYGGEEFVVILRESDRQQALDRVDQIRRQIEADAFPTGRQSPPARLTVSAGVAAWPDDGHDAESLTECADRRLFQAKSQGRNRVVGGERDRGIEG